MQIDFLADVPHYIRPLAPPLLDYWRFALPADTLDVREQKLRAHLNRDQLPIAWVAHERGEVLGTATLRLHDLEHRTDLSPWLGGVFVLPSFRGRGIASALCTTVATHAAMMGVPRLFLFTLGQQALYQRLGWQRMEAIEWHGFSGVLMSVELLPQLRPAPRTWPPAQR